MLAPPAFGAGVLAEATTQGFRYLDAVFALACLIALVKTWRPSSDAKAQAFLLRTASVPEQCSAPGRTEGLHVDAVQAEGPPRV